MAKAEIQRLKTTQKLREKDWTFDEIGEVLGLRGNTVKKYWYANRHLVEEPEGSEGQDTRRAAEKQESQEKHTSPVTRSDYNIIRANISKMEHQIKNMPEVIHGLAVFDIHTPFTFMRAWHTILAIAGVAAPWLNVFMLGGDNWDLSPASPYSAKPMDAITPTWEFTREFYIDRMLELRDRLPYIPQWIISGNHDIRGANYAERTSPYNAILMSEDVLRQVNRHDGLWFGWDVDRIKFPRFVIHHGNKTPQNAENAQAKQYKGFTVLGGHVHRYSARTETDLGGWQYTSMVAPSMVQNPAEYSKRKHVMRLENWQQGAVIFHYNQRTEHTQLEPLVLRPNDHGVWWQGEDFTPERAKLGAKLGAIK